MMGLIYGLWVLGVITLFIALWACSLFVMREVNQARDTIRDAIADLQRSMEEKLESIAFELDGMQFDKLKAELDSEKKKAPKGDPVIRAFTKPVDYEASQQAALDEFVVKEI